MVTDDERWMQFALDIAAVGQGQTSPNPVVGCVLVRDGFVVGQGAHLKAGGPHAEIHALRMAGEMASGATAYVTLEPCSHFGRTPPCADALIEAGVARVVVAACDPNPLVSGRGVQRLRAAGIDVRIGVFAERALIQNEAFTTWVTKRRPFVVWKCAATLDGRIAASSGQSEFVTGIDARRAVQGLRRQCAAIAVGSGTVCSDDPRLTVRGDDDSLDERQPVRVVFDSKLSLPITSRLLTEPGQTLIYTTAAAQGQRPFRDRLAQVSDRVELVQTAADPHGRVSLSEALADLGSRGVHSVLVEGGTRLVTALLSQQLIDKVAYFIAPKLLTQGLASVNGTETAHMNEAISLRDVVWQSVGADLCVTGYPDYRPARSDSQS